MAVIVGVDGSDESARALEWALDEAHLRGESLVAVHAYVSPIAYYPYGDFPGGPDTELHQEVRRAAEDLVSHAMDDVKDRMDGIHVERKVIEDAQPARALTQEASAGDVLVVGSRGRGGFRGLLLGSVSQQCVHHAPCPVVVIRGEET